MPIEARNLTYIYKPDTPFASTALSEVSLSIEKGEFLGIIGHTGSGKSTLIQHFNGLLKPTSGTLVVNGVDVSRKGQNLKQVRSMVGLVFQYPEHQLFEETVAQDIAFGPTNMGLDATEIERRVDEAMGMVRLDAALKTQSPFELSGGQKRRVAIAGVLAMRPDVLVMDEPTAGLDPRGCAQILDLMRSLHEAGHTLVLVTHAMEDVMRLATRIIVMNHGRIETQGAPRDVFKQTELLTSIGLNVPAAARIAETLRARGFALSDDAFTMEALEAELLPQLEVTC